MKAEVACLIIHAHELRKGAQMKASRVPFRKAGNERIIEIYSLDLT